jgi:lysophospholipase L1-like esterase
MKQLLLIIAFLSLNIELSAQSAVFYPANHDYVKYVGRADRSDKSKPKFWASGAYVQLAFSGTSFEVEIEDEMRYDKVLNYLEVKIDNEPSYRIQLKGKKNKLVLAKNLKKGKHIIVICKNTEAENGFIAFVGFRCEKLLPSVLPVRKMEFIGDSITCGFGADESIVKCGDPKTNWYDQHNAWAAYGPTTARNLHAQWQISAVSGIGLIHSCCDKKILMPQVYNRIDLTDSNLQWDFKQYQPDVLTICLGQNDGIQDSIKFCNAYVNFTKKLRSYYPKARIIFLSSPMADAKLKTALIKYITAVKAELHKLGDQNLGSYFFTKRAISGCGSHPSLAEQQEMAAELTSYVKKTMNW